MSATIAGTLALVIATSTIPVSAAERDGPRTDSATLESSMSRTWSSSFPRLLTSTVLSGRLKPPRSPSKRRQSWRPGNRCRAKC